MAKLRTLKQAQTGVEQLADIATGRLVDAHAAAVLEPLFDKVRRAGVSGNDGADLQNLLESLPEMLTMRGSDDLVDAIAEPLIQAALIGRTAASPDGLPELSPEVVEAIVEDAGNAG